MTVAAYLRRPSAYYLSALQQHLKASHKVNPPRALPLMRVINAYRRAFGTDAVRPRIYDRAQLAEGTSRRTSSPPTCPAAGWLRATSCARPAATRR